MSENLPVIINDGILDDDVDQVYDLSSLRQLEDVVKEYIESDCHAVVMDEEVLFNGYREGELSHREKIIEYCIREQIMNNIHRHLFVPLLRQAKNFSIEIFMFKVNPWKIVVDFDKDTKKFNVSKKI